MKHWRIAVCMLLGCLVWTVPAAFAEARSPAGAPAQRAVLVTGASSGIGRMIAETLAARGFFVFAGARKPADIEALSRIDNIQGIRLDVTEQAEVDAAVEAIRASGRGLYGLVNNAGVLITGPAAEVGVEQVRWLFDVNVFGMYRVTQAFLPQILERHGRIINVGSIAGNIGIRFLGPYSMSKHAVEAYTDALASELAPFGVHVGVVAPGDYASQLWKSDFARARAKGVVGDDSPYAQAYRDWIDRVAAMELEEPTAVAETVLHALSVDQPRRRYLVVPNKGEMAWVTGSAVRRLAEINHGHPFSYSAEELTGLLEASMQALSAAREGAD